MAPFQKLISHNIKGTPLQSGYNSSVGKTPRTASKIYIDIIRGFQSKAFEESYYPYNISRIRQYTRKLESNL